MKIVVVCLDGWNADLLTLRSTCGRASLLILDGGS
jgi:hypothetical protein